MDWKYHDRLTVNRDGEEIDVFNWCSVKRRYTVRATQHEEFRPVVEGPEGGAKPEAITEWLAVWLYDEMGIEAEDHGIEVVDIESDEVSVL